MENGFFAPDYGFILWFCLFNLLCTLRLYCNRCVCGGVPEHTTHGMLWYYSKLIYLLCCGELETLLIL